jgi:DNA-binding MarR family transcriptional regulator/GNAT superfamily N-acetyltransferase
MELAMSGDIIRERPHLFLGSRLKRLAEQMQGDVVLVAQHAGIAIQPGQYPLLATLDEYGSKSIGELARAMRMSQPAITKSANRLAAAGLVAFERNDADKRQRTVSLTSAGRIAMDQSRRTVWSLVEAAVKQVTDDLSGPLLDQIAIIEERLATRSLSMRAQTVADLLPAVMADVPAIVSLMNRAYRGAGVEAGWNTEAHFIDGDRTSVALLSEEMATKPEATLLAWRRLSGDLQGCVWLEPLGDDVWYLGSLTVDPHVQNAGLGRQLLTASENWVREQGGREIRMTVVNVRESLIAWYARRGYQPTGETEPFPYEDTRFGIPKRTDLCFVGLGKALY